MAYRQVVRVKTVVTGGGSSANQAVRGASLRAQEPFAQHPDYDIPVVRVGRKGVVDFDWHKVIRSLQMGQSQNMLLGLNKPKSEKRFTQVGEFVDQDEAKLRKLLEQCGGLDMNATVLKVKKWAPNEILVTAMLEDGSLCELLAQELITTFGSGAERDLGAPVQRRNSGIERPFKERLKGSQALSQDISMYAQSIIAIVGDGPTAIWAAERALYNGCIPYVIGPNDEKAFLNANPGGRNSEVLKYLREQGWLLTADIEGIEELNRIKDFSDPIEPGMLTYFKDLEYVGQGKSKRSAVLPVSRIVSAIGSAPCVMPWFDQNLVNTLVPMVNYGPDGQASIGLATSDYDVIVGGAQALSLASSIGLGKDFSLVGERIGQPAPGIVPNRYNLRNISRQLQCVEMGAKTEELQFMTSLFMSPEIDPYSADQLELSGYLQYQGMPRKAADEIASQLSQQRDEVVKKGGEFGNAELSQSLSQLTSM